MDPTHLVGAALHSVLHPKQFAGHLAHLPDSAWQVVAGAVLGGDASNERVYGQPPTAEEASAARQYLDEHR